MTFRATISRRLTERACNDPQRMRARKIEAKIIEVMPANAWLSCRAVSRLIDAADERKTRARLDRLVADGEIERKSKQGDHRLVYLYRRTGTSANSVPWDSAQLMALIFDLKQSICNLETSIKTEEDGASVRDFGNRRHNLLATISTLQAYLE